MNLLADRPRSIILAIDEPTLPAAGGMLHIRRALARAVRRLSAASPRVVALDVILADAGDPAKTRELSCALGEPPNPVLSCELVDDSLRWEDPRRSFPAGRSTSVTSMRNPMIAIR